MSFKMYSNQSFASGHIYLVLQAKLRTSKAGDKYIHFQIPGPAINRDYGYSFDIPMKEGEQWDELVKVFNKASVDMTNEKEEIKESLLEKSMYSMKDFAEETAENEDSKEEPELIDKANAMHSTLVKVLEEYKEQLNG